jgi:hypothetical protein
MSVSGLMLVDPSSIALASRALTAAVGFFVALLAYRGFRRNNATKMRSLAVGIGLLTTGSFLVAMAVNTAGVGSGFVLLARGLVSVAGLSVILHALIVD